MPNVVERLIESCRAEIRGGIAASDATRAAREIVAEAVSDPVALATALGEPEHAGLAVLHRAPDLTILNFAWAPWMCFKPHDHCMWSVVGIFSGREDNVFWRRPRGGTGKIEAAGARSLGSKDVAILGADTIHSVVNPVGKMTRAIHVYGGDFFAPPRQRTEYDPETLAPRPWDMDDTRRLFAEAEARAAGR